LLSGPFSRQSRTPLPRHCDVPVKTDSYPLLTHGTHSCFPESLIRSEFVLQDSCFPRAKSAESSPVAIQELSSRTYVHF
jgi:hypothetical protein